VAGLVLVGIGLVLVRVFKGFGEVEGVGELTCVEGIGVGLVLVRPKLDPDLIEFDQSELDLISRSSNSDKLR